MGLGMRLINGRPLLIFFNIEVRALSAEWDSLLAMKTLCLTQLLPSEECGRVKAIFSYTQGGCPRRKQSWGEDKGKTISEMCPIAV